MTIQQLYMTEREAAHRYGYSRSWFQRSRWLGDGPEFVKMRGRVLYPIELTDKWFESFGLSKKTS